MTGSSLRSILSALAPGPIPDSLFQHHAHYFNQAAAGGVGGGRTIPLRRRPSSASRSNVALAAAAAAAAASGVNPVDLFNPQGGGGYPLAKLPLNQSFNQPPQPIINSPDSSGDEQFNEKSFASFLSALGSG